MFNSKDLVTVLKELRQRAEREAERPAHEIETDLAALLADVCDAFYLGPAQHRAVLGDLAYQAMSEPVHLATCLPDRQAGDPWADLRAEVALAYASSRNVQIFATAGR
ncbi:MAG: hypothetical protein ACOYZ7_01180 [Chloroflexota bacterium]